MFMIFSNCSVAIIYTFIHGWTIIWSSLMRCAWLMTSIRLTRSFARDDTFENACAGKDQFPDSVSFTHWSSSSIVNGG